MELSRSVRRRGWRRWAQGGLAALVLAAGLFIYFLIQKWVAPRFTLTIDLDSAIPFVPAALGIYLFFFPFVVLAAAEASPPVLRRLLAACLWACAIAWTVFLLLPAGVPRPAAEAIGNDFLRNAFTLLHAIDFPHNTFPSLHVAITWIAAEAFAGKRSRPAALAAAAAISVSTLLVKQHALLDVAGGLLLAWVCLRLAGADVFHPSSRRLR